MTEPRRFMLTLKIRGCEEVFMEELGPGVLASKGVYFDDTEPNYSGAIAVGLLAQKEKFIQEVIEVRIEELLE